MLRSPRSARRNGARCKSPLIPILFDAVAARRSRMATRIQPNFLTDSARRAREAGSAFNGALTEYDYSNFFYSSSEDVFGIFPQFDEWYYGQARNSGYYLFGQPMSTPPTPHILLQEQLGHQNVELLNLASYN